MKADRTELRSLAEELAKVEGNIYYLKDFSDRNPLKNEGEGAKKQPPKNETTKWIIISVVLLILFFPAAIFTLYAAYNANKRYKKALEAWMDDGKVKDNLTTMVGSQEEKRKELLSRIGELCRKDPALNGNYWWKFGKDPAVHGLAMEALLPGKEAKSSEWKFAMLNQMWFQEAGDVIYLYDMTEYAVLIEGKDARAMLEPGNGAVIYQNKDLLTEKAPGYALWHLYAYTEQPIEEISKSTTRTAVDKEAERAAHQQKLDLMEIGLNAIGSKDLMTNKEMQMTGRMSLQDYVQEDLVRGMYEADFESKLSARGDYDEHTTYSKGFRGLSHLSFYDCADILISVEEGTMGQCAAIVVPRENQKITQLFVRSNKKDHPFTGRVESYDGNPGLTLSDGVGSPSIKMAVEQLFTPSNIEFLHLKNRDVLEEKPEGLDEWEFVYLMWMDNPKGRADNKK